MLYVVGSQEGEGDSSASLKFSTTMTFSGKSIHIKRGTCV